jgi:beta-fructofuranosidase
MTEQVFTLERANSFLAQHSGDNVLTYKGEYHFSAPTGWINDPNGLVYFRGEYHLFYQHYPYDSIWGAMHWGHAKSKDLLHWEHLPVALAPDQEYDKSGCFSGSALVKDDRLWLMYTGHIEEEDGTVRQVQNMAYSDDGITFHKISENPVLTGADLPSELIASDFRDPKIFERGGRYYAVVAGKHQENRGVVVLVESEDLHHWSYSNIFLEGTADQGIMWECPDYFSLDGKDYLVISPMRYPKSGLDFVNNNSSVIVTGQVDWANRTFKAEQFKEIDHGHDFYAPQTLEDDQGRRFMIAWMHTWGRRNVLKEKNHGWFGQMTLPRQLVATETGLNQVIPENILSQLPQLSLNDEVFEGGYLTLDLSSGQSQAIRLGSETDYLTFGYHADKSEVYIDRRSLLQDLTGEEEWDTTYRAVKVEAHHLDVIIDKSSIEVIVNQGEESLTSAYYLTEGQRRLSNLL